MMIGLTLPATLALMAVGLCILGWGFLASDRSLHGMMRLTCIGLGVLLIVAGLAIVGR